MSTQSDLQAVRDAIAAFDSIQVSDISAADWVETIRGVREKVQTFALFVPNASKIENLLSIGEKLLLGWQAFERLALATDNAHGIQSSEQAGS